MKISGTTIKFFLSFESILQDEVKLIERNLTPIQPVFVTK